MSHTTDSPVGLILRLTLGLVLLPHGLQQLLGLFGGSGFSATMTMYTDNLHLPWIIALLIILILSLGALLLVVGLWGRVMALLLGGFLLGAMWEAHLNFGFFMNWTGQLHGEGFEYHLLGMGIALTLLLVGSGRFSLDLAFSRRKRSIKTDSIIKKNQKLKP